MDYISMILFTMLFVAQIVLYILYLFKKRHDDLRYSALLQYIDRKVSDADCRDEIEEMVSEHLDAHNKKIEERFKRQDSVNDERFRRHHDAIVETRNAFSAKVDCMLLDYSQAQEAASKVNEFASGLASIFDYDPVRALQKGRNKEAI